MGSVGVGKIMNKDYSLLCRGGGGKIDESGFILIFFSD